MCTSGSHEAGGRLEPPDLASRDDACGVRFRRRTTHPVCRPAGSHRSHRRTARLRGINVRARSGSVARFRPRSVPLAPAGGARRAPRQRPHPADIQFQLHCSGCAQHHHPLQRSCPLVRRARCATATPCGLVPGLCAVRRLQRAARRVRACALAVAGRGRSVAAAVTFESRPVADPRAQIRSPCGAARRRDMAHDSGTCASPRVDALRRARDRLCRGVGPLE